MLTIQGVNINQQTSNEFKDLIKYIEEEDLNADICSLFNYLVASMPNLIKESIQTISQMKVIAMKGMSNTGDNDLQRTCESDTQVVGVVQRGMMDGEVFRGESEPSPQY